MSDKKIADRFTKNHQKRGRDNFWPVRDGGRRRSIGFGVPLLISSLLAVPVAQAASPAPVNLRTAGAFEILTESGITDVPASSVTGNVGASPITGAAVHLTCSEVHGIVYTVDAAGPVPCSLMDPAKLTTAINDMHTAYIDAAGRRPNVTELGGGEIGGLTLRAGVYKWSTGVTISNAPR